jgi:hypothetical protein
MSLRKQVDDLRAKVRSLEEANEALQQQASTVAALQDQIAQLQQSQVQGLASLHGLRLRLTTAGASHFDRDGNLLGLQLPPAIRQRIAATLTKGLLDVPDLTEVSGNRGTLLGRNDAAPFALISPVGVVIETNRPTFRWRQLGGEATYSVRLFDSSFNRVMISPPLTTNRWIASATLTRGRLYSWQVVAMKDGKEIVSPVPPAAEAKFKILDQAGADELGRAKRDYATSHLVLGVLYANAGLLDEAEGEFKALASENPKASIAQKLLNNIRSQRAAR